MQPQPISSGCICLKQWHVGLLLMISSFIVWMLATPLRFWYVIDLQPELGIGEPLWVIDPVGFFVISVPLGLLFLLGAVVVFQDLNPKEW